MTWQPIGTFDPGKTDSWDTNRPVLVWNGERVGEAVCSLVPDYDQDDMPETWTWAWTHHPTCSCCHSYMEPQPTMWQPLPEPPKQPQPLFIKDLELNVRCTGVLGNHTRVSVIKEILDDPHHQLRKQLRAKDLKELREVWENINARQD